MKKIINKIITCALPLLGGFLGALGGADNSSKLYRRILIPGLITSLAYSSTESLLIITIILMSIPISMGYGIPCEDDKGSKLGAFFYNLFNHNESLANVFTRGTIGVLIALSLISIPILKKNWLVYILCSLGICMINALMSWRNFGSYKLFGKTLNWVETIVWGLIVLLSILIIQI